MVARIGSALALIFILISGLAAQNLKVDEIVAKHLASIGTAEKRKEIRNMMMLGLSTFESKLPERKSVGKVAIVSEPNNLLFIASFAAENYSYEKIGIFGGKINIPFTNPGIRSPLGDFLNEHPSILKSGLFSGSRSLTWALLEDRAQKVKMITAGTRKIDGRKAYVIDYYAQDSDSMKIQLFFDAETFQHLRTNYREEFTGKESSFGTLGENNGYVIQLTEDFGDFGTVEGITLPNTSKVSYHGSSRKGTYEYDWTFKVTEVKFNQPLKEGFFQFN